jgi:plasmid maintenance system killer protein
MKKLNWEIKLGICLVAFSVLVYLIKYIILGDSRSTYNYIFNALGFLPLNVLLVTLILNKLLSVRAKRDRMVKLNMVIGTFFSEVGTSLLTCFSSHDPEIYRLRDSLLVNDDWSDEDFSARHAPLKNHPYRVQAHEVLMVELKRRLELKRDFLLRLLENPVLLEHESFTALLQAVFHLVEELEHRQDFKNLPVADIEHLRDDINRAYSHLALQWLAYMRYLKKNYPYLFSFALRTNPFDRDASPIVR